jgi:hypothetical protein
MCLRSSLLLLAVLLMSTAPLLGYTIYLKDGSHFQAKEPYKVRGDNALIVLPNGTQTSLPLSQLDAERTREANRDGYSGVLVMETPLEPRAQPAPERPKLSEVAADRQLGARIPGSQPRERPAAPTAVARDTEGAADAPRTSSGHVDLMRFRRVPFADLALSSTLSHHLRSRGIDEVTVYEGTRPGRVLLELTTNSEALVFRALIGAAEAMAQLGAQGVTEVEALEVLMITDRRLRAGQFVITPENAAELTSRRLEAPAFFVRYTQF